MFFVERRPDGSDALRLLNEGPRPQIPEFATLDALRAWLESMTHEPPRWLWRGVSEYDYPLQSKLQRVLTAAKVPPPDWLAVESAAMSEFQRHARPLELDADENDRLAWLGVMQHYGAPTRMTDWSWDPRVALWFACQADRPGRDRAVFVLSPWLCQSVYPVTPPETWGLPLAEQEPLIRQQANRRLHEAESQRIAWPLPLPVVLGNTRTDAQRAAFVCDATLSFPLELLLSDPGWETAKREAGRIDHVGWHVAGSSGLALSCHREHLLQKIRVPANLRDEVLGYLAAEGITRESLFPDAVEGPARLDGVGDAVEQFIRSRGR